MKKLKNSNADQIRFEWTMLFNVLGIKYIDCLKEKYSILTPIGYYCPDFYLPDINMRTTKNEGGIYFDIRDYDFYNQKDSFVGPHVYSQLFKSIVVSIVGPEYAYLRDGEYPEEEGIFEFSHPYGGSDHPMVLCKCNKCNRFKFTFPNRDYYICESCNNYSCMPDNMHIYEALETIFYFRSKKKKIYEETILP